MATGTIYRAHRLYGQATATEDDIDRGLTGYTNDGVITGDMKYYARNAYQSASNDYIYITLANGTYNSQFSFGSHLVNPINVYCGVVKDPSTTSDVSIVHRIHNPLHSPYSTPYIVETISGTFTNATTLATCKFTPSNEFTVSDEEPAAIKCKNSLSSYLTALSPTYYFEL